jgi:hypothetical protein
MLSSRSIGSCWLLILATAACDVGEVDDPDDLLDPTVEEADPLALTAGVNGAACTGSPYNCKFRATGGNRVMTAGGEESWGIEPGGAGPRRGWRGAGDPDRHPADLQLRPDALPRR